MLETEVNIRVVQGLMGHAGVKTTEVYTHVMKKDIQGVLSSLGAMMEVGKEGLRGLRVLRIGAFCRDDTDKKHFGQGIIESPSWWSEAEIPLKAGQARPLLRLLPPEARGRVRRLIQEVVQAVPYRHGVFSIPKILRRSFLYDRRVLCGLSRWARETLKPHIQEVLPVCTFSAGCGHRRIGGFCTASRASFPCPPRSGCRAPGSWAWQGLKRKMKKQIRHAVR